MSEPVPEFSKICRICLGVDKEFKPLSEQHLANMIMKCANILIDSTDGLPNQICFQCVNEVKRSYAFKLRAELSDNELRHFLPRVTDHSRNIDLLKTGDHVKNDTEFNNCNEEESPQISPNLNNDDVACYPCRICGKRFAHANWLRRHSKTHNHCLQCQKTFRSNLAFLRHAKSHAETPDTLCKLCNKKFKNISTLNQHRKLHLEIKPHPCSICEKSFISNAALQAHLARHRGEKSHMCTACGKSFYNSTDLKVHTRLHTGEKPLECSDCGKTFRNHSGLYKHTQTHRSVKNHICQVCSKAFLNASKLNIHMRVHTVVVAVGMIMVFAICYRI